MLKSIVASGAGLSFAVVVVCAQPSGGPNELDALLSRLVSVDPLDRESASQELEFDEAIVLKDIERLMAQPGLAPEQSRRLHAIARSRFVREPRAAVGVQFNPGEQDRNGVVVLERVEPTFPSSGVLQAGDRIEAIDGVRLSAVSPMRPHILSRDPGDDIPMTIVRQGVTMNVVVKLGRWSDLRDGRRGGQGFARSIDPTESDLDHAWQVRSRRYLVPAPLSVIEAGVPQDEPVVQDEAMDLPGELRWPAHEVVQPMVPGEEPAGAAAALVAGGEAHGGDGRESPALVAVGGSTQYRVAQRATDRERLLIAIQRLQIQRQEAYRQQQITRKTIEQTPPGPERDRLLEGERRGQEIIRSYEKQLEQLRRRSFRQ